MIAAGFRPLVAVRSTGRVSADCSFREDVCHTYPEAEGCSGTGIASCLMMFISPRGVIVAITTGGEGLDVMFLHLTIVTGTAAEQYRANHLGSLWPGMPPVSRETLIMDGGRFRISASLIITAGDDRHQVITHHQGQTSDPAYARWEVDCTRMVTRPAGRANTAEELTVPEPNEAPWDTPSPATLQARLVHIACFNAVNPN